MGNRFWAWANDGEKADNSAERTLFINGIIAEESTWFDDEVTPKIFEAELKNGVGNVNLHIDSPGGDVFAAAKIYNLLCEYPGKITVKIGSLAASAASVIAMAGDVILVSPLSQIIIHNPFMAVVGDSDEMKRAAEALDSVKEAIINAYENRTKLPRNKLSKMMNEERFISAHEAIKLGFADGLQFQNNSKIEGVAAIFNRIPGISKITAALAKTPENTIAEPQTATKQTGISIADLDKRLSLISH
jgi:ATP-dependent Clp protease protease subunit